MDDLVAELRLNDSEIYLPVQQRSEPMTDKITINGIEYVPASSKPEGTRAVAYEAGAQQERAAIVKWLREQDYPDDFYGLEFSRSIEAGEHLE